MGTRGCVAVGTPTKWAGVYNHFDSYPTGLGNDLFTHLITRVVKDGKTLGEIGDDILKFDDWRNYLAGGVCKYCGKLKGQPHSINGHICAFDLPALPGMDTPKDVRDNIQRTGYPDPDEKYHLHNDLTDVTENHISEMHSDPLFIEWVYIIDPKADAVHVLKHQDCKMPRLKKPVDARTEHTRRLRDGRFVYSHCCYRHVHVATIKLTEKPDWEKVECGELFEYCHHYASHHFPELEGKPSGNLGTRDYLAEHPQFEQNDAVGFIVNGKVGRRGSRGFSGGPNNRFAPSGTRSGVWYQQVVFADGSHPEVPVSYTKTSSKGRETPYSGIVWLFPPTLHQGYTSEPEIGVQALTEAVLEFESLNKKEEAA